jgi:sulfur-carrier protein adenylyltransferase/sulfurtransferase
VFRPENEWNITPEELKECIHQVKLVDVREPEEFEVSRIEPCTLLPLGELQNKAEQILDKNSDIVVYCAHGIRSLYGVQILQKLGFKKLRSLSGGIVAWEQLHYGSP